MVRQDPADHVVVRPHGDAHATRVVEQLPGGVRLLVVVPDQHRRVPLDQVAVAIADVGVRRRIRHARQPVLVVVADSGRGHPAAANLDRVAVGVVLVLLDITHVVDAMFVGRVVGEAAPLEAGDVASRPFEAV